MKLLIATGLYPPDIGGPATYTVFLEQHAPQHGFELTVVPFTTFRRYPVIVRHFLYLFSLVRRARGCAVILALDTVSVGIPALLASFVTSKPLVLRVPGDYAWEQGQQRFGVTETLDQYRTHTNHDMAVRVLAWLQNRVAMHARHVIVPSDYMKTVVHGWGVPSERITRIYSELKPFDSTGVEKKDGSDFVVTTAARLVPWKGIAALIDAIVSLRTSGVPVNLTIIGDGVCRTELESQVHACKAEGYVRFLGALERSELGKELVRSDVFVLNTSYEGLSHQLLEVMSLGIPIVTTPVGGNVELIEHNVTGLMVPFNDIKRLSEAIRSLYQDRELGVALTSRARDFVQKFDGEILIGEFAALMRSLRS
jgi:glycosyltransferase involved in cell wall biosynthesis